MDLETATSVERLARACQIVIGLAIDWAELPTDATLLGLFDHLPQPCSHLEALATRTIFGEFVRRLGVHVHQAFHRRYGGRACVFTLPDFETSTQRTLDESVFDWMRDWLHRYRHAFDAAHATAPLRARRHLDRHFEAKMASEDLAALIGVQRRTLDRQFRIDMGMRVMEYRMRVRVAEALRQLKGGVKPESVALQVGWKSKKNLYRAMRRLTGLVPTDIRTMPEEAFDVVLRQVWRS